MRTIQTKQVTSGAPSKYTGIFIACMMLVSCSSGQNAFFVQRNALMSQGHTWQKLDKCRPAKKNALSIPVVAPDGRKLVCYILGPPENGVVASTTKTNPAITEVSLSQAAPPSVTTPDANSGTSGVSWNFSNF